jgi:hypothetical protein
MISRLIPIALTLLLAGCDIAALLADPKAVQREADAKAIGGACRYAVRSIEDCYTLNEKASKSLVFQGWKEMDQYMRDNKIDGVPSTVAKPVTPAPAEEIIEEEKAKPKAGAKAA